MEMWVWGIIFIGCFIWWVWPKSKDENKSVASNPLLNAMAPMLENFQKQVKEADRIGNKFRMKREPLEQRGTVLQKNEEVILDVPVIIARSVKTGAQWKSGSRGVRVSPIRGLSFNLGGSRGKMTATSEFQKDVGWLTLTSKRICFKGQTITFAAPIGKIENISRDDALCFIDLTSRDIPDFHAAFPNSSVAQFFTMLYSDPDREIELNMVTE